MKLGFFVSLSIMTTPSILNYEKAHLLDPTNEDIEHNLRFAQNMTIDFIEELPPNAFDAFINSLWCWMKSGNNWWYKFLQPYLFT